MSNVEEQSECKINHLNGNKYWYHLNGKLHKRIKIYGKEAIQKLLLLI